MGKSSVLKNGRVAVGVTDHCVISDLDRGATNRIAIPINIKRVIGRPDDDCD
jgi:hypothetical protein